MRNVAKVAFVVLIFVSISFADQTVVADWRMDEGSGTAVGDSSGNNYDGTFDNAPSWVTGMFDDALSFDGSDDRVKLAEGAVDGLEDFTFEAWVKTSDLSFGAIISGANSGRTVGWMAA